MHLRINCRLINNNKSGGYIIVDLRKEEGENGKYI